MKTVALSVELEVDDNADEEEVRKDLEKALTITRCAYCGHESPKDDNQAIADHIFTCDKRPEKKLMEKAFEIEDKLYGWVDHLVTNVYMPDHCDLCAEIRESVKIWKEKDL